MIIALLSYSAFALTHECPRHENCEKKIEEVKESEITNPEFSSEINGKEREKTRFDDLLNNAHKKSN